MEESTSEKERKNSAQRAQRIPSQESMRHTEFWDVARRLQSFCHWPAAHLVDKDSLADAGFFYLDRELIKVYKPKHQEKMEECTLEAARKIRDRLGNHEAEVSFGGEADLHKHYKSIQKNPGHNQFIPVHDFKKKHLSPGYHDKDILDWIRAEAGLTCPLVSSEPIEHQDRHFRNLLKAKKEREHRFTNQIHTPRQWNEAEDLNSSFNEFNAHGQSYRKDPLITNTKDTRRPELLQQRLFCQILRHQLLSGRLLCKISQLSYLIRVRCPDLWDIFINRWDFKTVHGECHENWEVCIFLIMKSPDWLLGWGSYISGPNVNIEHVNMFTKDAFSKEASDKCDHFETENDKNTNVISKDDINEMSKEHGKFIPQTTDIHDDDDPNRYHIGRESKKSKADEKKKEIIDVDRADHHEDNMNKISYNDQESDGDTSKQEPTIKGDDSRSNEGMTVRQHAACVDICKGTGNGCQIDQHSNKEKSQYGIYGCHETVDNETLDVQADNIEPEASHDTTDQMHRGKADCHDGDLQKYQEGSVEEDAADNSCYSSQNDVTLMEEPDVTTDKKNVSREPAAVETVAGKMMDSKQKLKLSSETFGPVEPISGKNAKAAVDSGRDSTVKGFQMKLETQNESQNVVIPNNLVTDYIASRRPNYFPYDEVEMTKSRVKAISRSLKEDGDFGQPGDSRSQQLSDNIRISSLQKLSADGSLSESWYKDMCSLHRRTTWQDLMMYPLERFGTTSTQRKHPAKILGIPWEDFERETMRLASFSRYPIDANKSSSLLAESGFVYIGDGMNDKVICFYCHLEKENWRLHEDIGEVHKAGSPHCPMVINLTSNNNATTTEASAASSSARAVTYSSATGPTRGGGFSSVSSSFAPAEVEDEVDIPPRGHRPPTSMPHVQAGQQSINNTSSATPYTTHGAFDTARHQPQAGGATPRRGTQQQQPSSQQATQNHQDKRQEDSQHNRAHHPNINSQIYSIPRNPDTSNDTSTTTTPSQSAQVVNGSSSTTGSSDQPRSLNYRDLGILCERPKHPELAVIVNRVLTYDGWPQDHHLKPDDLAKAGFHYAGYADCCKCFFCGGGLRKWDLEDDPFVEHARWFPKCGYIRQLLGDDFIVAVQELKGQALETITMQMVKDLMKARGMDLKNQFDDTKVEDDAAVRSLTDEGYDKDMVYRIATDLKNSGVALSADVILEKINATTQPTSTVAGEDVPDSAGAAAGRSNADDEDIQELKDQNYTLRNNLICKICMDKEVRMVFLPCGHLVSCQECAVALQDCPVCRKHIRATVRASIR